VQVEISAAPKFLFQNLCCFPQIFQAYAGILYPNCNAVTRAGKSVFVFTLNGQVHFFRQRVIIKSLVDSPRANHF